MHHTGFTNSFQNKEDNNGELIMERMCSITILEKRISNYFKERLTVRKKNEIIRNLKCNWYFPISALAFFGLSISKSLDYFIGLIISICASIVVSSQIPSIIDLTRQKKPWLCMISVLSAFGICWNGQITFYKRWVNFSISKLIAEILPANINFGLIISIFAAIISIIFVYFYTLLFWEKMSNIFFELNLSQDITVFECGIYCFLILLSFIFVISAFLQTEAFYGTKYNFDIIYTSDSSSIVINNAYMTLMHPENDFRQPLFAVFSAPFTGIPFLIGSLFNVSLSVQAILLNLVQVCMMFLANFMLAKLLMLKSYSRVCFMLLISNTYTYLLFSLMMEQYIIAYFWLVICLIQINEKNNLDRLTLWGAGGTLLTSMILLPFMSNKNPFKYFRTWFREMISYGMDFIFIILAFGRFEVFNLSSRKHLMNYTGQHITTMDKLKQYTAFIKNYYIAPDAGVNHIFTNHISWQMKPIKDVNMIGVIIILLVISSAFMNRKKKSSILAISWIVLSIIVFLLLGWGTSENGLILYELYFGWAFLVLLVQLVELIEIKLNINFLVPLFSIVFAIIFAMINVPAIMEMINFAITYYPT